MLPQPEPRPVEVNKNAREDEKGPGGRGDERGEGKLKGGRYASPHPNASDAAQEMDRGMHSSSPPAVHGENARASIPPHPRGPTRAGPHRGRVLAEMRTELFSCPSQHISRCEKRHRRAKRRAKAASIGRAVGRAGESYSCGRRKPGRQGAQKERPHSWRRRLSPENRAADDSNSRQKYKGSARRQPPRGSQAQAPRGERGRSAWQRGGAPGPFPPYAAHSRMLYWGKDLPALRRALYSLSAAEELGDGPTIATCRELRKSDRKTQREYVVHCAVL